jgi:hypothetical protein
MHDTCTNDVPNEAYPTQPWIPREKWARALARCEAGEASACRVVRTALRMARARARSPQRVMRGRPRV